MLVHPLITAVLLAASVSADTTRHELRYAQPTEHFEETLLLGNGRVGASVFGGVETERIYLNDATLWSGGPVDPRMNPQAFEHLPAVREALAAGDWESADRLVRQLQGS
ncbi:MAG: glycoside hydrolase N-terminal domain-containing protein, partial [Gemmatimonadetes bacterium]|nr:glycoside hydrolase N-terminal domain-containing protein [Gemmatimonadota bacterium]